MKNSILSFLIIITINCFGQSFPKNNPNLLLNKIIKPKVIDENMQSMAYQHFYFEFDFNLKKFTNLNKPYFYGGYLSEYNKLVGKEFKVLKVHEANPITLGGSKEYAIEMENNELGKVFYRYFPDSESSFELEVIGGIDIKDDYYCSDIEYSKDKFDKSETYISPTNSGINFMKINSNNKKNIYMTLRTAGQTLLVRKNGLFILFSDGTKLNKPTSKVEVESNSRGGYLYSVNVKLNLEDIKILESKLITDYRIHIFDDTVKKESAEILKNYIKCLKK